MNNTVSSRAQLIEQCKEIVREKGIEAVSIRAIAEKSQISIGAVYNYFPNKGELLAETLGSVWGEIFHFSEDSYQFKHFTDCLAALFKSVAEGKRRYPNFFTSQALVLAFDEKNMGMAKMALYWHHIKDSLLTALDQDQRVRPAIFDEALTKQQYVDYIFDLFLNAITKDYPAQSILKLVENSLY